MTTLDLPALRTIFGPRLEENVSLARLTAARVGGPATALVEVNSAVELAETVSRLWEAKFPFIILGGGSNVLISDGGVDVVVVLNHARQVQFEEPNGAARPGVWAEAGVNFGLLARQAALRGLSGLEWAAGIPGTLGGAVFGNAGAHGGDTAGNLIVAEILHLEEAGAVKDWWSPERLGLAYRNSALKRQRQSPPQAVVLSARLGLQASTPEAVQAKIEEFVSYRRRTQPPGASLGSMFKNPPGDYAGRLIEAAGLKGARQGKAQISPVHANFFINEEGGTAADIYALIELARRTVAEKFGLELELEIELLGDWTKVENQVKGTAWLP